MVISAHLVQSNFLQRYAWFIWSRLSSISGLSNSTQNQNQLQKKEYFSYLKPLFKIMLITNP